MNCWMKFYQNSYPAGRQMARWKLVVYIRTRHQQTEFLTTTKSVQQVAARLLAVRDICCFEPDYSVFE